MYMLRYRYSFRCLSYSISTLKRKKKKLLKTFLKKKKSFSSKTFSPDDDLRSKLVEKNQKLNNFKEKFLFVKSCLFLYIYIYIYTFFVAGPKRE